MAKWNMFTLKYLPKIWGKKDRIRKKKSLCSMKPEKKTYLVSQNKKYTRHALRFLALDAEACWGSKYGPLFQAGFMCQMLDGCGWWHLWEQRWAHITSRWEVWAWEGAVLTCPFFIGVCVIQVYTFKTVGLWPSHTCIALYFAHIPFSITTPCVSCSSHCSCSST